MKDITKTLKRLEELDEQKDMNSKEIIKEQDRIILEEKLPLKERASAYIRARKKTGKNLKDEIFEELNELLPLFFDLKLDEREKIKNFVSDHANINQSLPAYVAYAADKIKASDDSAWLKNALTAATIFIKSSESGRELEKSLEHLYVSAHEAGLTPDNFIDEILSYNKLDVLLYIKNTFSKSDRFKRITVKKPEENQLLSKLQILFDNDTQTRITDLIDLSDKQDIREKCYENELSRLMSEENKDFDEADILANNSAGPDNQEAMLEKLDFLIPAFINMNRNQRNIIKEIIHTHNALLNSVTIYTVRAAYLIKRNADPELLMNGLTAAAIEDATIDFRDTLIRLGIIYKAAHNSGLNPDRYFMDLGQQLGSQCLYSFTETAHFKRDVKPSLENLLIQ
ncbi:hypothetical protein JXL83_02425 [candidate division WOR-3 bacterium]|nr:hypothetical protein [candidate division WOR-3 bacterium]